MIHDVSAARADALLKRDGRDLQKRRDTQGQGLHVTRVALDAPRPAPPRPASVRDAPARMKLLIAASSAEVATSAEEAGSYGVFGEGE
jgi:hypothetical protein